MADSFQPDSFTPDTTEPAPQKAKDSFVADSFTPDTEEEKSKNRLVSEPVTAPEIESVAKKYGVDPQKLKDIAPYFNVQTQPETFGEALSTGAKAVAGEVGQTGLLGAPQFIYKKMQDEPTRKAIDELKDLADQKKSTLESVTEFGRQIAVPLPALPGAGKAAGRIAGAAGIGAVGGLTSSKEGEEARGAATGAALGAGFGVGAELLGKLAAKYKPSKIDEALVDNQTAQRQFNIDEGVKDIQTRTSDSEKLIEDIGFGRKDSVSKQELDTILDQQIGKEKLDRYLNPSTEEGALIRKSAGSTSEGAVKEQLLNDIIERRARDFAEDLTGKRPANFETAVKEIEDLSSRQGSEAISNRYKQFVEFQQAEKYIEENGLRALGQPEAFSKTANFMSDNQFVFRGIDEKYGTKTEDVLRELNKDFNRSTFAHTDFRQKFEDVFKLARKEGVDDTVLNSSRIYDALDTGKASQLTPQEKAVADKFRNYFNEVREFVNGKVKEKDPRIAPLSIPFRENYVPKMIKQAPELVSVMEKKLKNTIEELNTRIFSRYLGKNITDLAQLNKEEFAKVVFNSKNMQELVEAVNLFNNLNIKKPIKGTNEIEEAYFKRLDEWENKLLRNFPNGGADLSAKLKEMLYSRDGNIALETQARAALERKGEIPDFMLEKNLYKLARRYTDNTIKHLYLRNNIDKLRYQAQALEKAGADVESKYVRNIVRDLLGVRKGTAAEAMMQSKIKLLRSMDNLIERVGGKDTTAGGILTGVKAMPDMFQELTRQIYPNVLGFWNVRAVLQNATQSITKTAPELGTKYGYATLLRAAVNTIGNKGRLIEKGRTIGNLPNEFIRAGERAIAEGIQRSSIYQIPKAALDGMGKFGMILFQRMEEFNRALTISVGEIMARDLARESKFATDSLKKLAMDSLKKFPTNVRKEILSNIQDSEKTSELISKYLNDVTMYNYNRASMSEFGRVMGPFFSTFSKWPTATIGDIIQEFRNKGAFKGSARVAEKYIAPFLLLQSIDYLMGERSDDKDSLTDRQKKLVGTYGLSQSAPIGSIGGVLKGEIFTPPAVDAFVQTVVNPILEGDTAKLEKGAGTSVMNFAPGAGLFRFIFDDAVTYITGSRPEGSNPVERVIEGSRQVTK